MPQQRSKKKFTKTKYEETLRNAVVNSLRKDFGDPKFFQLSITKVELSDSYDLAKIWWDTFDPKMVPDLEESIKNIKGKLRSQLAGKLDFRFMPELIFYYDSQYEEQQKMEKILKENYNPSND